MEFELILVVNCVWTEGHSDTMHGVTQGKINVPRICSFNQPRSSSQRAPKQYLIPAIIIGPWALSEAQG